MMGENLQNRLEMHNQLIYMQVPYSSNYYILAEKRYHSFEDIAYSPQTDVETK